MSSNIHGITPGRMHGKPGLWQSGGVAGPFGNHATLGDVKYFWKLNEESGVRTDEVSATELADNNTVLFTSSGKIDNAATYVAGNTEKLSIGSLLIGLGDYSVCLWIENTAAAGGVKDKYFNEVDTGAPFQSTCEIARDAFSNNYRLRSGDINALQAGDLGAGWHFIIGTFGTTDDKARLYIDDGSAGVSGARTTSPSANKLELGLGCDCNQDLVGIWDRVFTAGERSDLWNDGDGLDY